MNNKLTILSSIAFLITIAGVFVCFYMLIVPRSLFWDEAAIATSILTRNFSELVSEPLEYFQTAPVLYLYAVKFCTFLFGDSETSLRLTAFVSHIGLLVMMFSLMKSNIKLNPIYVRSGIAIAATLSYLMLYATSVKPYSSDTFFILSVFVVHNLYCNGRISFFAFTIYSTAILFFSSQTIFFSAAVFIYEFFRNLSAGNKRHALVITLNGLFLLTVFGLYYMLWLSPAADGFIMQNVWKERAFILFSCSLKKWIWNLKIIAFPFTYFTSYRPVAMLILLSSFAGFIISWIRKDLFTKVFTLGFILFLLASTLGKSPIEARLCLFFFPIAIIYVMILLQEGWIFLSNKKLLFIRYLFVSIIIGLFYNNLGFVSNIHFSQQYHETNPLIKYVKDNIKGDETLFCFVRSNLVLRYKNHFNPSIGREKSQIIYGQSIYDWQGISVDRETASLMYTYPWDIAWDYGLKPDYYQNEIEKIIQVGKAYLLFSHLDAPNPPKMLNFGLERLRETGRLTEVMNVNETYLYYYETR